MINEKFLKFITENKLFTKRDKILVGLSGGPDSIFLTHLLVKNGFKCAAAHMNFNLRKNSSDEDEKYAEKFANQCNIKFYSKKVDTKNYALDNKLSIEMAARELRYQWFHDVLKKEKYKYIAIGHNQDDSIETYLLNLIRGTGLTGLTGIKPKNDKIVRPILCFTKIEIENYLDENDIFFRTDMSNFQAIYVRNRIRHRIIPEIQEINKGFKKSIVENIRINNDIQLIYNQNVEKAYEQCVVIDGEYLKIDIEKLKNLNPKRTYLFEFLRPFNFNSETVDEILQAISSKPGKQYFSETHRLLKDREFLIVSSIENSFKAKEYEIKKSSENVVFNNFEFEFSEIKIDKDFKFTSDENIAFLDLDKIKFPLKIRNWHNSDRFIPLGMTGFKKVSDFLIDKKINRFEKQKVLILESENKIAWLIGHRIDNRFKITVNSNKILKVVLKKIKD